MTPLPLAGLRVADLSWIIAGPYGTELLARMGAEVIKIEGVGPLDHTRENPPFAGGVPGLNRSGFFNSINMGKKSLTLQLDDREQAAIAREIMLRSDLVIEAFSYGTMERFGLGYEALRRERPDLIMVSVTGFGQEGRDRGLRAFMGTVHAYTGLNSLNGYVGGPPKTAGGTFADYATGLTIVFSALAALRHRQRTGLGQHIDLSMADVILALTGAPFIDYFLNGRDGAPQGNAGGAAFPNNVYPCRGDDAWVAVSIETDAQWDALRRAVGDPALDATEYRDIIGRRRHVGTIDARLAAWSRERTAWEATEALQVAGVPAGPSCSAGGLLAQPQLRARGFFCEPGHPETGPLAVPNLPWRLDAYPDPPPAPAPCLGEHTEEIVGGWLGRPRHVVDRLNARRDEALRRLERAKA